MTVFYHKPISHILQQKSRSFSLDKSSENLPVSFFLGWQNPLHLLTYPSEVGHLQVFSGSCPGHSLVTVLISCSVYSFTFRGSLLQNSPGKGAWGGVDFLNLCVPPKVVLVPFTQYLAWLAEHAQAGNDFPLEFWRVVVELPGLLLSNLVPF